MDKLYMGVVILDTDLCVRYWNNWMSMHTTIDKEKIIGAKITEVFPNLNNPKFLRSMKSVMTFGNYYFISQRLHRYLIPMKPTGAFPTMILMAINAEISSSSQ